MSSPVSAPITPTASTQAQWQAWANAISAALDSAGVPRVVEGGAVASAAAWLSVTKPGVNTAGGFELRKLADPPSGGCPVYIRLVFGVGSLSTVPTLTIQTGTGTDGSGALTGPGSAVAAQGCFGSGTEATVRGLYVTYDGDGLVIVHAYDASVTALRGLVVVDRQRNATGTAAPNSGWTNTGYMRLINSNSATTVLTADPVSGDVLTSTRTPAIAGRTLSAGQSMVSASGDLTLFPVLIPTRQGLYTSKMLLAYPSVDANVNTDITGQVHLGSARTYRALGGQFTNMDAALQSTVGAAIWWGD